MAMDVSTKLGYLKMVDIFRDLSEEELEDRIVNAEFGSLLSGCFGRRTGLNLP